MPVEIQRYLDFIVLFLYLCGCPYSLSDQEKQNKILSDA